MFAVVSSPAWHRVSFAKSLLDTVRWKNTDEDPSLAEATPCICNFTTLEWHICGFDQSRQPASITEISQLIFELYRAIGKERDAC